MPVQSDYTHTQRCSGITVGQMRQFLVWVQIYDLNLRQFATARNNAAAAGNVDYNSWTFL